jgi:hypothetical protein
VGILLAIAAGSLQVGGYAPRETLSIAGEKPIRGDQADQRRTDPISAKPVPHQSLVRCPLASNRDSLAFLTRILGSHPRLVSCNSYSLWPHNPSMKSSVVQIHRPQPILSITSRYRSNQQWGHLGPIPTRCNDFTVCQSLRIHQSVSVYLHGGRNLGVPHELLLDPYGCSAGVEPRTVGVAVMPNAA